MPSADSCLLSKIRSDKRKWGNDANIDVGIKSWVNANEKAGWPTKGRRCRCCPPDFLQGWIDAHGKGDGKGVQGKGKDKNAGIQGEGRASKSRSPRPTGLTAKAKPVPPWRSSSSSSAPAVTKHDFKNFCIAWKRFYEEGGERPAYHRDWSQEERRQADAVTADFLRHVGVNDPEI
jgi:hypothetical protein